MHCVPKGYGKLSTESISTEVEDSSVVRELSDK